MYIYLHEKIRYKISIEKERKKEIFEHELNLYFIYFLPDELEIAKLLLILLY